MTTDASLNQSHTNPLLLRPPSLSSSHHLVDRRSPTRRLAFNPCKCRCWEDGESSLTPGPVGFKAFLEVLDARSRILFIDRISEIPSLCYPAGKLVLSSTSVRCSESGRRDCRFPMQRYTPLWWPPLDLLDIRYKDP